MKILSIAQSETGGGLQTVFRINNNINNFKSEIEIIKAFSSDEIHRADINLKTIREYTNPFKKALSYFHIAHNYNSLKKVLVNNEIDVIHIHSSLSLSLSIFIAIKKYKKNAKVIQSAHGYGLVCPIYSCFNYSTGASCNDCVNDGKEYRVIKNKCDRRGYVFSLVRYLDFVLRKKITDDYGLYDYVVTPSEYSKNLLLQSRHIFKNVDVVSNPIEMEKDLTTVYLKKDIITYLGRFSKEKNVGMLIDAFVQAKKANKNLFLNIIGDGEEKQMYLAKIKRYGIESSVYVSEKFLNKEEFREKLLESKVLSLPSVVPESFGLVLFEGIRYGLIPVSLNIGAQAENIRKIGTGIIYEKNDSIHLEKALTDAISNYDSLINSVQEANIKIDKEFSIEKYYNNIFEVYKEVLEQN